MNSRFLSLAVLGLLFPSTSRADMQNNSADAASTVAIPFRLSGGYLIQVGGRIGTQTNLKFILDTGAPISIVDQKIADKLKLDRHPAESFNFDRNLKWESATFPEVQFGPIQATGVRMFVGQLVQYSEFARNVDAIIGMDLLKLSNFSIDYDARKIIFHPSGQKTPFVRDEPLSDCLILEIRVQGQPVRLIVDTGLPGILFYEDQLRKHVPTLRTVGNVTNVTMGARLRAKQATLPDVVIGRFIGDVSVLLVQAPSPEMLPGIDGIIGIAPLKARRINFDFQGKMLSWD
jgi:predicted aspartyl protease